MFFCRSQNMITDDDTVDWSHKEIRKSLWSIDESRMDEESKLAIGRRPTLKPKSARRAKPKFQLKIIPADDEEPEQPKKNEPVVEPEHETKIDMRRLSNISHDSGKAQIRRKKMSTRWEHMTNNVRELVRFISKDRFMNCQLNTV